MHEKQRTAILKLLESEIREIDKYYICVKCHNIVQRPNLCASFIDGREFLAICNPCKIDEDNESDRKKEEERQRLNLIRFDQMKDYLSQLGGGPDAIISVTIGENGKPKAKILRHRK